MRARVCRSPRRRARSAGLGRLPLAPLDLVHPEGELGGVDEGAAEAVGGAPFRQGLEDLVEVPPRLVEPLAVALEEREREEDRGDERRLPGSPRRVERLEEGALRPVELAPLAEEVPEGAARVDRRAAVAAEEVEGEAVARLRLVPAAEDLVAGAEGDGGLGLPERRAEAAVDLERALEAAARRGVVAAAALEGREVRERGGDPPEVARALGLVEALALHRLALLPAPGPREDGREGREGAADEVAPLGPAGRLDGGGEALLGRLVVAAQEGDRPERAEEERAEVVGAVGTGEREARPRPSPRRRRGLRARGAPERRRRGGAPAPRSCRPCRAPPPPGRRGHARPPRRRGGGGSSRS